MFQRTSADHRRRVGDRAGPPWRLLVESRDPSLAVADFTPFVQAGFEIQLCEGPEVDAHECPAVNGAVCPLLETADIVLFDIGTEAEPRRQVLDAIRTSHPELPVVVRTADPPPPEAVGCATIRTTTSVPGQVEALREAVLRPAAR
jgi:DNA-binding NarL/FixJ family response regulator